MRWINHKDSFSPTLPPHQLLLASHSGAFPAPRNEVAIKVLQLAPRLGRISMRLKPESLHSELHRHRAPLSLPAKLIVPFLNFFSYFPRTWTCVRASLWSTSKILQWYEQNWAHVSWILLLLKDVPYGHHSSSEYKLFSWSQFCTTINSTEQSSIQTVYEFDKKEEQFVCFSTIWNLLKKSFKNSYICENTEKFYLRPMILKIKDSHLQQPFKICRTIVLEKF